MENKYYTPTIEEFCEGFQYEKRVNTIGEEVEAYFALDGEIVKIPNYVCTEEDWVRKTFSNNENQEIVELLKEGKIRVKYHDKEDIESLGFICMKSQPGLEEDYIELISKTFCIDYDYSNCYCRIYENYMEGDATFFAGTIKNKNELKRVLTMLNIYNENL